MPAFEAMGFPVPSDIEQSLDLNQYLIHNPAATFFMRVEGNMVDGQEVHLASCCW